MLQEHLPQLGRPPEVRIPPGQGLALGLFAPGHEGGARGQFQQGVLATVTLPGLAGPGHPLHLFDPEQDQEVPVSEGQIEEATGEADQGRVFFQGRRDGGIGGDTAPVVGIQPVLEGAETGLVGYLAAVMALVVQVGPGPLGLEGRA